MCSVIRQTAYLATAGGVQWPGNKEKAASPLASGAEAALGMCVMGHLAQKSCSEITRSSRQMTTNMTEDL